jgi:Fe-S oxidoreductase
MTLSELTEIVCPALEISIEEIRSKNKSGEIAIKRMIVIYFACELNVAKKTTIGRYFNSTTVYHAEKTIKEKSPFDSNIRELISKVRNNLPADNKKNMIAERIKKLSLNLRKGNIITTKKALMDIYLQMI